MIKETKSRNTSWIQKINRCRRLSNFQMPGIIRIGRKHINLKDGQSKPKGCYKISALILHRCWLENSVSADTFVGFSSYCVKARLVQKGARGWGGAVSDRKLKSGSTGRVYYCCQIMTDALSSDRWTDWSQNRNDRMYSVFSFNVSQLRW